MLCPWCLHYGVEDDEYLFDDELYCGICAQQFPESDDAWTAAFRAMDVEMLPYMEQELNRIAGSKSGIRPELRQAMGDGIAALAELRESGMQQPFARPERDYVRWVRFACSYFAPRLR